MAVPHVADLAARLWLVTRFGCCVQVFHDYVADVTVVRLSRTCRPVQPRGPQFDCGRLQCVGPSMLPTFNRSGGDIVVCEHVTPRWGACRTPGVSGQLQDGPDLPCSALHCACPARPLKARRRGGGHGAEQPPLHRVQTVCARRPRAWPDPVRLTRLFLRDSILGFGGEVIRVPDTDVFGAPTTREVAVRDAPPWLVCGGQRGGQLLTRIIGCARSPQVPSHHVWLQGDNTRNSNDSRHYGPVPVALVRGRVCFKVWPLTEAGPIAAAPRLWA